MTVVTVVTVVTTVWPTVSSSAPAACGTGEKAREEGVELGDPILGDLDGDRLVLRCGGGYVGIHLHLLWLLTRASIP